MQYFKTAASRRKAEQNGLVVYASAAIIERKEPIIRIPLLATGYRLCVYASGSLITVILNCVILIRVTCLHLGQNREKFFNSVSSLICTLVLFLQIGQRINSVCIGRSAILFLAFSHSDPAFRLYRLLLPPP